MTPYTPEWAREDSPTKGLSTEAMLKYYKDHSVAGWCRFYLENPGETSPELLAAIQALYDACVVKQKPAHKLQRELLARRWQTEAYARNTTGLEPLRDTRQFDSHLPGLPARFYPTVTPAPAPAPVREVRHLPVIPSTISFKPAKIAQRYLRRAA